jgi:hypothetical protein
VRTFAMIPVMSLAIIALLGCENKPQPPSPAPAPTKPAPSTPAPERPAPGKAAPVKAGTITVKYTAKRISEITKIPQSQIELLWHAEKSEAYEGHADDEAVKFTDDCKAAVLNGPISPKEIGKSFRVPTRQDGADWCVFFAILGTQSTADGEVIYADADDMRVSIIQKGEPVYAVRKGYAIMGGYLPVARGRRSRGGASGTWFVVETTDDVDRYYLLNDKGSHEVSVLGIGEDGSKQMSDKPLTSRDKYIEVGKDGKPVEYDINKDPGRVAFRDAAYAAAKCANLDGNK